MLKTGCVLAQRRSRGDRTLRFQRVIDHADKILARLVGGAELLVIIGERFCRDRVGFARSVRNQFGHPVAGIDQHRPVTHEVGLGAKEAVTWNDLGLVIDHPKKAIAGLDHALDVATVGKVDVGIAAGREGVAGREHVGLGPVDVGGRCGRWRRA